MKPYRKFMAGYDLHGDMQNRDVVKKFFEFSKAFSPDIKIMGGAKLWYISDLVKRKDLEGLKKTLWRRAFDARLASPPCEVK